MEFSKKVLEFLGNEPDKKRKPEELLKYVPKLMNIVDTHIFSGNMINRKVRFEEFTGDDKQKAGRTQWRNTSWKKVDEIVLNSRLVNTLARLVEILFHELCHQAETELKGEIRKFAKFQTKSVLTDKMHGSDFYSRFCITCRVMRPVFEIEEEFYEEKFEIF